MNYFIKKQNNNFFLGESMDSLYRLTSKYIHNIYTSDFKHFSNLIFDDSITFEILDINNIEPISIRFSHLDGIEPSSFYIKFLMHSFTLNDLNNFDNSQYSYSNFSLELSSSGDLFFLTFTPINYGDFIYNKVISDLSIKLSSNSWTIDSEFNKIDFAKYSLNGNGSIFKDLDIVDTIRYGKNWTVQASFIVLLEDNKREVYYKLSKDNRVIILPETMLVVTD